MKPRDVFRVVIATTGWIAVCYGVISIVDGLLFAVGLSQLQHTLPRYYGARGLIQIVLGLLVMRGVPPLVDWAFPTETKSLSQQNSAAEDASSNQKPKTRPR